MLLRLGRSAGTQAVAEAAAPRPELCFGSFAPWSFKRGPLKGSIRDTIRDTLRVLYCLVLSREWGNGYWGLYYCGLCRDYCRDPFPHSLLSTRESSTLLVGSLGGFGVELRSFRL